MIGHVNSSDYERQSEMNNGEHTNTHGGAQLIDYERMVHIKVGRIASRRGGVKYHHLGEHSRVLIAHGTFGLGIILSQHERLRRQRIDGRGDCRSAEEIKLSK